MLLAIVLAPLILLFLYLSNLAVAVGRIGLFNLVTIFSGAAAVVSALITSTFDGSVADYLFAACIALLFSCLLTAAFIIRGHTTLKFEISLFREGISYALRAYFATLFGFLLMRVGIIALQQRSDFAQVGQFSIAMQMTDAMILLPGTVGLLLFPNLVRAHPDSRWPEMLRALVRLGTAMAVLLLVAAAVVPFAVPIVYGAAFETAGPFTLAMLPTVQVVTLTTVVSQYLSAGGFPFGQVTAWIFGFLIQAVLSFALAGPYGGYGIAVASFISNAVVLGLLAREAIKLRRQELDGGPLSAGAA
jgi:O-antigen/teichoic acid export membrane protein